MIAQPAVVKRFLVGIWKETDKVVSVAESRRGVPPRYFKPEYMPFREKKRGGTPRLRSEKTRRDASTIGKNAAGRRVCDRWGLPQQKQCSRHTPCAVHCVHGGTEYALVDGTRRVPTTLFGLLRAVFGKVSPLPLGEGHGVIAGRGILKNTGFVVVQPSP